MMPDLPYRKPHAVPTRYDRVTFRPWEHAIAGFDVVLGALLIAQTTPAVDVLDVYALPGVVFGILGALLAVAGVLVLVGLQWPRSTLSYGWAFERVGCLAAAGGWLGVGAALVFIDPVLVPGCCLAGFMLAGNLLRFRLLGFVERETRADTGTLEVIGP